LGVPTSDSGTTGNRQKFLPHPKGRPAGLPFFRMSLIDDLADLPVFTTRVSVLNLDLEELMPIS
ncbi:hypothetical protein, partial [Pseudomonas viridiflava]|uniref:hypothetical protein n=1 Tax=Pseudomonas viridiflava TaxID=33069 RepID=UPI00197D57F8